MIPKQIMAIIGFPGMIVHEWAHKLFCKFFNVNVTKVKYWGFDGGYVRHAPVPNKRAAIFISFAPLIVNTLIALLFGIGIAVIRYLEAYGLDPSWLRYVNIAFWYFGVTIGAMAFPSENDTRNILEYTRAAPVRIMHFIFVALNKLRFFGWIIYMRSR